MKLSALLLLALTSSLLALATPRAALAGVVPNPSVPEPSAILIWTVVAGVGGAAYWRRDRRGDE